MWRVAGAYVIVAWMAVEIVLETFPLLGFPGWVPRVVVLLAFAGFPVTLVLAWAFDLTAHGVVRTPALEAEEPGAGGAVLLDMPRGRLAGVFGAGILVALVGFGAYSTYAPSGTIRPEAIQSIAVLPFSDPSESGSQRYFADGVTEELINRLSRLQEVRVAARTSSFALREERADLATVAERLKVDAVVDGSVRREGDQLRVTVELIDVRSGFQIWAEKYDRTVDDIFAIQDDISAAIVDALRLQLAPGASRLRAGTESVRAHDAYLLGLSRWNARTEADLLRALAYFEEAAAEDAGFAPAYAGIALTYAVIPAYSDMPAEEAADRGSEAAARALALDAQLAEGHAAIGQIAQSLEWNLEAAEMAYRRAIEFQPSYATAHQWYAETLMMRGRLNEADREIETALRLDPLSLAARTVRAYLLTVQRRYDEARQAYQALVSEQPDYALAHMWLTLHCLARDCRQEAVGSLRAALPPAVAAPLIEVVRALDDPARRERATPRAQGAGWGRSGGAARVLLGGAGRARGGGGPHRAGVRGRGGPEPAVLRHPSPVRRRAPGPAIPRGSRRPRHGGADRRSGAGPLPLIRFRAPLSCPEIHDGARILKLAAAQYIGPRGERQWRQQYAGAAARRSRPEPRCVRAAVWKIPSSPRQPWAPARSGRRGRR
ncbi:MAG: hypothetical protein KY466_10865 [Gemmatimonadetes bacterium]|nr:hypothetical protein [Gemmatimonadota bacterium]